MKRDIVTELICEIAIISEGGDRNEKIKADVLSDFVLFDGTSDRDDSV